MVGKKSNTRFEESEVREAPLRKWCLCQDFKMNGRRWSKGGGTAFNPEGTENENALE